MQNSNYPNGHVPYTNGAPSHAEGSDGYNWLQTPTVAAAMTFTPFSSIVPFNPGMRMSLLCLVMLPRHMSVWQARSNPS